MSDSDGVSPWTGGSHNLGPRPGHAFPHAVLLLVLLGLTITTCQSDQPAAPPVEPPAPGPSPPVSSGTTAVLVGAGQIARCDGTRDESTAALLDNIPGTVFTTGDNVRASGSTSDFNNCYGPTWGRHKVRTRPSPGDLDYQTAGAAGYFGYFGTAAGEAAQGYYSYELGDWHIVALNSNISMAAGSPQAQWLGADLAANPRQCILAYWHHPRFSSRGTSVRSSVKPLWDVLYAAGADVILNAHYRVYERFAPQTPDEVLDAEHGIRQFTVGTGGHGAEAFSTGGVRPNSQVRSSGTYGVLKLTLAPGSYAWEFVPVAGQTFTDTGSDLCDRSTPVTSVEVTPASATVSAGSTVQLTATPRAADGAPLVRPVTWSTSDPQVATVSGSGLVTGGAEGTATITATSEGRPGTSTIQVAPPPPGVAILVGAGDVASCSGTGDETTAALLDVLPGQVMVLGDNAYPDGTASDYACYDASWGRHKARTRPSPGNHDYHTADASGYFGYFGAAAGDPDRGYYSYDLGDWHIIVLNSNISRSAGSLQEQWLRADLAASPGQCTLAYWHHPLFTSSVNRTTNSSVKPLWDALYEAGTELIVNGHDHHFERFAPQRPDGAADPVYGIRQITAGTGGASLYSFGTPATNSVVRDSTSRGVLKLALLPGAYSWEFVPVPGATLTDNGTGSCHGPPTPPPSDGVSASQSTVALAPTAIPASGGGNVSIITVTAKDASGNPVKDVAVTLSATGGGNTLDQPAGPADANGVASGTLSSTVSGPKTVTAVAGGVIIGQQPVVTVTAGAPSASGSTVVASPATIVAGSGASTITVTVKDDFGNPVSGATVGLDATGTGNALTQPSAPTDASGVATGTLVSTQPEVKTISATANGTPLAQTAGVTVLEQGSGATITHTLLTAGNNATNQKVYTTAGIAPGPNALVTVAVVGHRSYGATASPTLAGGGMAAWTEVASVTFDSLPLPYKRLTIFRAVSATPGSSPLTITFPGNVSNCQWIVSQWEGVDITGVNGAGAIIQTAANRTDGVSGLSGTLAALAAATNVAYGVVGVNGNGLVVTPGTGFTEIAEQSSGESPRSVLESEWAPADHAVAPTWTGLLRAGMLAVELKAKTGP